MNTSSNRNAHAGSTSQVSCCSAASVPASPVLSACCAPATRPGASPLSFLGNEVLRGLALRDTAY